MVEAFVNKPEARHKDTTPNLGVLMALLAVSNRFTFEDLRKEYLEEKLTRNVFWMQQKVPQLKELNDEIDE